jgi:alpha-galactosidase
MDDQPEQGRTVRVDAGGWGLTLVVDESSVLRQVGLGPDGHEATVDVEAHWYPLAFPTYGEGDPYLPAPLRITHDDGTLTTRLTVRSIRRDERSDGERIVITLADESVGLTVDMHIRTHPVSGVVEQHLVIQHDQAGPVVLHDYDSICTAAARRTRTPSSCSSAAAGGPTSGAGPPSRVHPGTTSLASLGGLQPHLQRSPVALLSPFGPSDETAMATCIALSVAWGGNTRIDLDVQAQSPQPGAPRSAPPARRRQPVRRGLRARPGPSASSPPSVAWTWSAAGRRELTRRFHDWTRARVAAGPRDDLRPIVANNWEATFFDFDQDRIVDLIGRSAAVGADLFLLDDGWFGTDLPARRRHHEPRRLGRRSRQAALRTGSARAGAAVDQPASGSASGSSRRWSTRSATCFVAAPRLGAARSAGTRVLHRNQLVLDTLQPEVREFAARRGRPRARPRPRHHLREVGRQPAHHRPRLGHVRPGPSGERVASTTCTATWDADGRGRVVGTPTSQLMLCASGGGRTDHGTLRHFHEFWTSDNTDPGGPRPHAVGMRPRVPRFDHGRARDPVGGATARSSPARWRCRGASASTSTSSRSVRRGGPLCRRRAATGTHSTQDLVQAGRAGASGLAGRGAGRVACGARAPHRAGPFGARSPFAYQLDEPNGAGPALSLTGLDPTSHYEVISTDLSGRPESLGSRSGADLSDPGIEWPLTAGLTSRWWELRRAPERGEL